MIIWKIAALTTLVVAGVQARLVVDRISHGLTLDWKGWVEPGEPFLTAGVGALILFSVATTGFVALGLVASDKLRRANSPWRYVAGLGVQILLAGALVWIGLILSPAVTVVVR